MLDFGDDEFVHRNLHRVGRAGHGEDQPAAVDTGRCARKHRGRPDLGVILTPEILLPLLGLAALSLLGAWWRKRKRDG